MQIIVFSFGDNRWQHLPVVTLLTGEAFQVVHVVPGPHHHLESWDNLRACSAVPSVAKQPAKKLPESYNMMTLTHSVLL
jgi:hypothetical protein